MANNNQRPWYRTAIIIIPAIAVIIAAIIGGIFVLMSSPQLPTSPIFKEMGVDIDTDGNYEISWESSKRATKYTLQEDMNYSFTSPRTVYGGSETKKFIYGKSDGDYYYRVRACNDAGESDWSPLQKISVVPFHSATPTTTPRPTPLVATTPTKMPKLMPTPPTTVVTPTPTSIVTTPTPTSASTSATTSALTPTVTPTPTPTPTGPSTEPPTGPSTGTITVASSPAGASIYLDDEYRGNTQHTIAEVSPGTHNIELRLEGYEDWSESVQVMAGETSYLEATLTPISTEPPTGPSTEPPTGPSTGTITVASSPAGVSIYLDGEYMGNTQHTIAEVSPGTHTIELRLEGYEVWSESVQVMAGETSYLEATLTPISTEPPTGPSTEPPTGPSTGTITVASSPAGVSIYLDGEYMGNTQHTIAEVFPGTHTIELRLEGYEVWSESVQVMAGETTYVDATMIPTPTITGFLSVTSSPTGADIAIDGRPIGEKTPHTVPIDPGRHTIKVTLAGYPDWTGRARVTGGETIDVHATFDWLAPP